MSHYHLSLDIVRRSRGQSVCATYAYDIRDTVYDRRTGTTFSYRNAEEVTSVISLIGGQAVTGEDLWNAAELREKRRDAQLAYRLICALPNCLSKSQNLALIDDFLHECQQWLGWAATAAYHAKAGNGHVHFLGTTRAVTVEDGKLVFGEKLAHLNPFVVGNAGIMALRHLWADAVNCHLERAGSAERVDHRSYADRGMDMVPQLHEGPTLTYLRERAEANCCETKELWDSDIVRRNDLIREARTPHPEVGVAAGSPLEDGNDARAVVACGSMDSSVLSGLSEKLSSQIDAVCEGSDNSSNSVVELKPTTPLAEDSADFAAKAERREKARARKAHDDLVKKVNRSAMRMAWQTP